MWKKGLILYAIWIGALSFALTCCCAEPFCVVSKVSPVGQITVPLVVDVAFGADGAIYALRSSSTPPYVVRFNFSQNVTVGLSVGSGGLAVSSNNALLVTRPEFGEVLRYNQEGVLVHAWNASAVDNLVIDQHNNIVYTTRNVAPAIGIYSLSGRLIDYFWDSPHASSTFCKDIAIDSNRRKLYCLSGDTQISVWDVTSVKPKSPALIVLSTGAQQGGFQSASALAVDTEREILFVLDSSTQRLSIVQPSDGKVEKHNTLYTIPISDASRLDAFAPRGSSFVNIALVHPNNSSVSLWQAYLDCPQDDSDDSDEDDWDRQLGWALGLGIGLPLIACCIVTFFIFVLGINTVKNEHF